MSTKLKIKIGDTWHNVEVVDLDSDPIEVIVDGDPVQVKFPSTGQAVTESKQTVALTVPDPQLDKGESPDATVPQASEKSVVGPVKVFTSPMPGIIISVSVKPGDKVVPGDEICVLEAMKMQQTLRAEWTGIVDEIHVETGQQIQGGDKILGLA